MHVSNNLVANNLQLQSSICCTIAKTRDAGRACGESGTIGHRPGLRSRWGFRSMTMLRRLPIPKLPPLRSAACVAFLLSLSATAALAAAGGQRGASAVIFLAQLTVRIIGGRLPGEGTTRIAPPSV